MIMKSFGIRTKKSLYICKTVKKFQVKDKTLKKSVNVEE